VPKVEHRAPQNWTQGLLDALRMIAMEAPRSSKLGESRMRATCEAPKLGSRDGGHPQTEKLLLGTPRSQIIKNCRIKDEHHEVSLSKLPKGPVSLLKLTCWPLAKRAYWEVQNGATKDHF